MAKPKKRYPDGYRTVDQVNIGYYAYVVRSYFDADVRTVPGLDGGETLITLKAGKRFGVQSKPNPDFRRDPPMQDPVLDRFGNAWVIGYSNTKGKTGWVMLSAITPDRSGECWADGPTVLRVHPERRDFQVGCGTPRIKRRPRFVIGSKRDYSTTIKAKTAYFRWASFSTGRGYLHFNDHVHVLWTTPFGWSYVEVIMALDKHLIGKRGHIRTKDLRR